MNEGLSLGEKIHNYRKRAGFSQMELETAIGAANGSISRIEHGEVNPTKETILQIRKALQLNDKELADLLEIRPLLPTKEEIAAAVEECRAFLDQEDVLAYLIDENAILHAVSKGFITTLNIPVEKLSDMLGKSILEITLNPKYGVFQYLDMKRNITTFIVEFARVLREAGSVGALQVNSILKTPIGKLMLKESGDISMEKVLSAKSKQVFFKLNGKAVRYSYARERLKTNSRFELIEFFDRF